VLATASWEGEWLGPDDGDPLSELDLPVIGVPAGTNELADVIARIHRHGVVDLTEAIDKLQAQRRMERGLLAPPAVQGVPPELKRRLDELGGAAADALGPGEIGLVDEPGSLALLHVRGELRERVVLDVAPPVHLAIEAPELVEDRLGAAGVLRPHGQELALQLLRKVVAQLPVIPVWLRHRLRRAMLSGRVVSELEGIAVFETADGAWADRAALTQQRARYGDIWCIPRPVADPTPLDGERVVVMLGIYERELANRSGLLCVDASDELALDAQARANLARPRPASLALGPEVPALATVTLDGDGRTAPRGVVAVLAPGAAAHRGTYAHRELHPFDPAPDPCAWPTRAIVDDAALQPDRTWAHALPGAPWDMLIAGIRQASEAALRDLCRPPPRAVASLTIDASIHGGLAALRDDPTTQIRGTLWLEGPPNAPGRIEVVHAGGTAAINTSHRSSMRGTLYVFGSADDPRIQKALDELCGAAHRRILAGLAVPRDLPELAAAHLAYGIAIGRLDPAAAHALRLGCFRPRPIDAAEWAMLCRSQQVVPLIDPAATADELSVTDDGTPVARVVLDTLGERASRVRLSPLPAAPPERVSAVLRDAPARPSHALDPLVAAVAAQLRRLGLAPPTFAILDGATAPIVAYNGDALAITFAGAHPRLVAISAGLVAKQAWSAAALDALVAHVVTVLNIALTSVTDVTEAHALGVLLRGASPAGSG
jgi:hypothetical protein